MRREEDLLKKLNEANNEVAKLTTELAEEKRKAGLYNDGHTLGTDIFTFMEGLVDAGMTNEQAFELMIEVLKRTRL